jgi:uncharacterized integral membrane protein
LQAGGRGFESHRLHEYLAPLRQKLHPALRRRRLKWRRLQRNFPASAAVGIFGRMADDTIGQGSSADETPERSSREQHPPERPPGDQGPVYRGTGVSAALIIGIVLAVLALILAIQNTKNTTVKVFAADYEAPLVVVILAAGLAGVILDEIVGFFWRRLRRRRLAESAELRRLRRS